jgi:hypothetical protein
VALRSSFSWDFSLSVIFFQFGGLRLTRIRPEKCFELLDLHFLMSMKTSISLTFEESTTVATNSSMM